MKHFIFLLFSLAALTVSAQPNHKVIPKPRIFHLNTIRQELPSLRMATIERVYVRGDNTIEGDQRILDTLRQMLAPRIYSTDNKHSWKGFSQKIKHLTIINAHWTALPTELGEFGHLSELTFVRCPNLNLQVINDQVKSAGKGNGLYEKFNEEIISLTFEDADWNVKDGFKLDSNLFTDLREVRLIKIGNFHQCCVNLLGELQRCYPSLGWLSLVNCGLHNALPLDTLRHFTKLQALSLAYNQLTRLPALPQGLRSVDVSFNLIDEITEVTADNNLRMLYLDCNLFHQFSMIDIRARQLYPKMEVLTFECNNISDDVLRPTVEALDKGQTAPFMSYARRYVNNFRPETPDCRPCLEYRRLLSIGLLGKTKFTDSNGDVCRLNFDSQADKIIIDRDGDQFDRPYDFLQVKRCEHPNPGQWVITFEVKSANTLQAAVQRLIANVEGDVGTFTIE